MTSFSLHVPPAIRSATRRWPSGARRVAVTVAVPVAASAVATLPATSAAVAAPAAGVSAAAPAGAAAQTGLTSGTARGALAAPGAVPGPPSGWSTVFSDDFNGAAGSGADSQWMYDTGPGSSFGTGEIETMTNSTSNVHLDGNGNLDITALGSGGSWTSGRIQTTSANVGAPAGGELEVTASIQQPAGGSATRRRSGCSDPASGRRMARSTSWRTSTRSPSCPAPSTAAPIPAARAMSRNGIGSGLRSCSGCQSGYHTYTDDPQPHERRPTSRSRSTSTATSTSA